MLGEQPPITPEQPPGAGQPETQAPAAAGADQATPPTSVINFTAGQTRANNATVMLPADSSGSVSVVDVSTGTVHLILDVSGYFQ